MGFRIREARKDANITQDELAAMLGINRATLSKYESGIIEPSVSQLKLIAEKLSNFSGGRQINWFELCSDTDEQKTAMVSVEINLTKTTRDTWAAAAKSKGQSLEQFIIVTMEASLTATTADFRKDHHCEAIGKRIKDARKKANMTQAELAQKLNVPFQSVSQWERDIRHPKYETLKKIAAALDMSVDYFLDKSEA